MADYSQQCRRRPWEPDKTPEKRKGTEQRFHALLSSGQTDFESSPVNWLIEQNREKQKSLIKETEQKTKSLQDNIYTSQRPINGIRQTQRQKNVTHS